MILFGVALSDQGLQPHDIKVVIGTHGHSDHIGNLNLFQQAMFIVCYDICSGDTYIDNELGEVCDHRILFQH